MDKKIGQWAFILGIIVAVLAAVLAAFLADQIPAYVVTVILVILGLVVGYLNISDKEITQFLVATLALLAISGAAVISDVFPTMVVDMLENIGVFIVPAALVVALKTIYVLCKE